MIRFRKAAVIFTTAVLLIFCVTENIRGEEKSGNISSSGEIIFLLDTSASMNAQDRDREAIDAIRQAVYSLPSDYRVGLVAYNTDIQTVIVPGTPAAQMEEMLAGITYTGYTNAGEGLAQAVGLFSEGGASDCCIVMLTDGEIDMPDSRAGTRITSLIPAPPISFASGAASLFCGAQHRHRCPASPSTGPA